jgi:hypothetical protein
MARAGHRHLARVGLEDGIDSGRHRVVGHRLHIPVDELERTSGAVVFEGVGVKGGSELAHQGRGPDPVADDIPDHDPQLAVGELEQVVPVPAHLVGSREVPGGGRDSEGLHQAFRKQAPLQDLRDLVLVLEGGVQPCSLDARPCTACCHLQDGEVRGPELARDQRPHMQDADQIPLDDHRDAEQRADAFLAQDWVQDVGVIHVGDVDRHALGRDSAREPLPDGDPDTLLDLLLNALGRPGNQLLRFRVDQQDGDRVHRQCLADPNQELVQKFL